MRILDIMQTLNNPYDYTAYCTKTSTPAPMPEYFMAVGLILGLADYYKTTYEDAYNIHFTVTENTLTSSSTCCDGGEVK